MIERDLKVGPCANRVCAEMPLFAEVKKIGHKDPIQDPNTKGAG